MDLIVTIVIFVSVFGFAVILASVFLFHKCRTTRITQNQQMTTPETPSSRRFKLEHGKVVPVAALSNASIKTPSLRSHWSAIHSHPTWLWSRLFLPRDNSGSMPDPEANRDHFMRYAVGADITSRYSAPVTFSEKQYSSASVDDTRHSSSFLPRDNDSNRSSVASSFHTCPSKPNLIFIPGRKNSAARELASTEIPAEETVQRPSTLSIPHSKFYVKQEDSNWISRSPLCSSRPVFVSDSVIPEDTDKVNSVKMTKSEVALATSTTSPSSKLRADADDRVFNERGEGLPISQSVVMSPQGM